MKKIKDAFWLALGIGFIGYFIYKIVMNELADNIPRNNAVHIKAVIIDERNYLGNQKVKPEFSYSYQFIINNEKYTGNSHDLNVLVGDTVEVEYDKTRPYINKPLNPKN